MHRPLLHYDRRSDDHPQKVVECDLVDLECSVFVWFSSLGTGNGPRKFGKIIGWPSGVRTAHSLRVASSILLSRISAFQHPVLRRTCHIMNANCIRSYQLLLILSLLTQPHYTMSNNTVDGNIPEGIYPYTREGKIEIYNSNRRWMALNESWSRIGDGS